MKFLSKIFIVILTNSILIAQQISFDTLSIQIPRDIELFNGEIYVNSVYDGLVKSTDNGVNWETVFTWNDSIYFNDFVIDKDGIFYAAEGYYDRIIKSYDFGNTWIQTSLINIEAYVLEVDSNNTLWVSSISNLFKSSDGGENWDTINIPAYALDFNSDYGVLCTHFNPREIYITSDSGITWNNIYQVQASGFRKIRIDDNNDIYCAGDYSFVKSTDLGNNWQTLFNNESSYEMIVDDSSIYFVAGIPLGPSVLYKGNLDGSSKEVLGAVPGTHTILKHNSFLFIVSVDGLLRLNLGNQLQNPNFFPTKAGDAYQFKVFEQHEWPIYHTITWYKKSFAEEYIYQNNSYVKLWDKYLRMDSTTNKLFILVNGVEKLACDFDKPTGSTDTLYFGESGVYTYQNGSSTWFGQMRLTKEIKKNNFPFRQSYTFADGIGYYYEEDVFQDTYNGYYKYHSAISAILDSVVFNPIGLEISPILPAGISDSVTSFDVPVDIIAPYIGLVNSLSADVVVYSSGNIIYQNTYQGNIELEKITVSLSSSILSQADSVGIQVRCTDESIFINEVFYPESGYYFIPVLGDISWNLIVPNLNVPIPQTMKFFTSNNGIVYGKTQSVPDPPYGIKNSTTDGGQNFSSTTTNIEQAYIKEIFRTDANTAYMLLSIWRVEKTTDMGNAWLRVLNNLLYGYSISFINNDTGWVSGSVSGGTNGVSKIFRTFDGGSNWISFNTPQQEILTSISFISVTVGYAVSESGKVYYSTDSGETWTFTNATITNQKILAMFENGTGWLVGNGIWRTQDSGYNWDQQLEGDFVDAHFFNKDKGWVIGSSNGSKVVLYTNDGGTNWDEIEVPEMGGDYLYLDFVDEAHGWIYSANKRLLKTTNGGVTYVEDERFHNLKPTEFTLSQNYPNPFNPSTKISWQSPIGSWQTLKVYDVLGREVATLVDEFRNAGSYEVEFNASYIPSGVYFYQIKTGVFVETKKMILLK